MLKCIHKRQLTGKSGFQLSSLHLIQCVLCREPDDPTISEDTIYKAMDRTILIGDKFYITYAVQDYEKLFNNNNDKHM